MEGLDLPERLDRDFKFFDLWSQISDACFNLECVRFVIFKFDRVFRLFGSKPLEADFYGGNRVGQLGSDTD